MDIANKIKSLRAYLSLSQAAFAEPLNLSPTHIVRFERGVSKVPLATISLICSTFSVDNRYFTDPEMPVEDAVKLVTEEEKNREIGNRLKTARLERGLSQMNLRDMSGIEQSVITRVENGGKLTEKSGRKLAEALKVGYQWIVNGDEDKKVFPADEKMINWLWSHPEVREELWKRMKEEE